VRSQDESQIKIRLRKTKHTENLLFASCNVGTVIKS